MHTITLQVNNKTALTALQDLETRHLISILENSDTDAHSLPGKPLSVSEFSNWIHQAEQSTTISLTQAKEKWAGKRKQLQKLSR
jgi:hypothetical protein